MPTAFPAPLSPSPLIKFFRWSFLFTGVAYGAMWQRRHTNRELALKDVKEKEKAARDAQLAKEKALAAKAEMDDLERMAGIQK